MNQKYKECCRITGSTSSRFWLPYIPDPSESTPRFPNRNQLVVLYPFVSGPSSYLNLGALNHPSRLVNARNEELSLTEDEEGEEAASGIWEHKVQGSEAMSLARSLAHPRTLPAEDEDQRWDFYWSFFSLSIPDSSIFFFFFKLRMNPRTSRTLIRKLERTHSGAHCC